MDQVFTNIRKNKVDILVINHNQNRNGLNSKDSVFYYHATLSWLSLHLYALVNSNSHPLDPGQIRGFDKGPDQIMSNLKPLGKIFRSNSPSLGTHWQRLHLCVPREIGNICIFCAFALIGFQLSQVMSRNWKYLEKKLSWKMVAVILVKNID